MNARCLLSLLVAFIWCCNSTEFAQAQSTAPNRQVDSSSVTHTESQIISFEIAKPEDLKPRDSVRKTPPTVALSAKRQLPPSILAELRRSQRGRTLIYHDTLRGTDLTSAHLNDSVEREYSDSALAIVDTAVSLSHKEWLDSEMVEIPELSRFGSKVHFEYPPSIMTETDLSPVPFDTTLLSGMNPVTRENLPFFDQSPIPMPLASPTPMEAFVEAGAGNVYQPTVSGWVERTISERTAIDAMLDYRNLTGTPLHSYLNATATVNTELGADPAIEAYRSSNLKFALGYSRKSLAAPEFPYINLPLVDHTVSEFDASLLYANNITDQLHYEASISDDEWSNQTAFTQFESSQTVNGSFRYTPDHSWWRLIGEAAYSHTGSLFDAGGQDIGAENINVLFGDRHGDSLEWLLGATILGANDNLIHYRQTPVRGSSVQLLPLIRLQVPLNATWSFGANYEPEVHVSSWRTLVATNPFVSTTDLHISDAIYEPRSVVMDKTNVGVFVNYSLSQEDNIRIEGRFITRSHDPFFYQLQANDSAVRSFMAVSDNDSRQLTTTISARLHAFSHDVLTASFSLLHVDRQNDNSQYLVLPESIEPTIKADFTYHFNSISNSIFPSIEFRSVSSTVRTINLLNAEARIVLMPQVDLFVRTENILGSASDFWPGYPEYPRSVWASVRYRIE